MKKILSFLLSTLLLLGVVATPVSASAANPAAPMYVEGPEMTVPAGDEPIEVSGNNELSTAVPLGDHPEGYTHYLTRSQYNLLTNLVEDAYKSHTKVINLSQYKIPYRDWQKYDVNSWSVFNDIICSNPRYFDLVQYKILITGDHKYLYSLELTYNLSLDVYLDQLAACDKVADYLVGDLVNADIYPDIKALIAHDRLALWNEYDHEMADSDDRHAYTPCQTMYGALVLQKSVCEGYTMAYSYMLDKLGITNYNCETKCGKHVWNIVKLNQSYYHVDVTWDDADGAYGEVEHENFLCSNADFGHEKYEFDRTPTNTYYDNFWWQYSFSEFQLINDDVWFVINRDKDGTSWKKGLICYYDFDTDKVYSVVDVSSEKWYTTSGSYYVNNQTRLDTDGTYLYYNLPHSIVRLDVNNYSKTTVKSVNYANYHNIWGFKLENGVLFCQIYKNANPDFSNNTAYGSLPQGPTLIWSDGGWKYVKNGKVDTSATTIIKHNGVWNYVKNGKVDYSANTLCKYGGEWFYINHGGVDWNSTTLCNYGGEWFYVTGGKVGWNKTTLCKYGGEWFYVTGGKVGWNKTTLCKYGDTWFYVTGGKVGWNSTTLVKYSGTWFYVEKGTVNWTANKLVKHGNSLFHVKGGKVCWTTNAKMKYNGRTYTVRGGTVKL